MFVKVKASVATIGVRVSARKPTIHGERKTYPHSASRRARDGWRRRRMDGSADIGPLEAVRKRPRPAQAGTPRCVSRSLLGLVEDHLERVAEVGYLLVQIEA